MSVLAMKKKTFIYASHNWRSSEISAVKKSPREELQHHVSSVATWGRHEAASLYKETPTIADLSH